MPAVFTWGGVALAVLGVLVAIAGLPDRAAGLGLGSDLIQAGAVIFAAGVIVAALGQVLGALRSLADQIEDAAYDLSNPRASLNDELSQETPRPLPRAAARDVPAREGAEEPPAPRPREPQTQPSARAPRPAPEAPRPQPRMPARADAEEETEAALTPRETQPRWMRAQAETGNRTSPEAPLPPSRSSRATPTVPAASPRREPAPAAPAYEPEFRRRPSAPVPEPAPAEVSVVRSGIIAGMAYTLYSDGSIEAELPAGLVRFASLAELQEHVKRAGAEDQHGEYSGSTTAPR